MHFVPDAKVLGFLNLSSSQTGSLVRMEQYESTAFEIAQTVTADPTTLTGCDAGAQGEAACVAPYLADFGKRAYRRPLTGAETDGLHGAAGARRGDGRLPDPAREGRAGDAAVAEVPVPPGDGRSRSRQVAQGIPLTSWEMATRLSYFLTGSIPDAELAAAADAGRPCSSPTSWSGRRAG